MIGQGLSTLWHVFRADFLERIRGYGFMITIFASMLVAFVFIPPNDAKYAVVVLNDYRGVYNSAWIGSTVSMSLMTMLSLFGFYLVKSAIERDRYTRVGEMITITPLSKVRYMLGKYLSNVMVLLLIVFFIYTLAVVMQLIRFESTSIQFLHYFYPAMVMVVPLILLVAALALLFESVPFLRGGLGNIIYFFLWIALLNTAAFPTFSLFNQAISFSSPMGTEVFYSSMIDRFTSLYPNVPVSTADGILSVEQPLQTFEWSGVAWTAEIVFGRFIWAFLALVVLFAAVWLFKGFDKERIRKEDGAKKSFFNRNQQVKESISIGNGQLSERVTLFINKGVSAPLSEVRTQFSFLSLLWLEFKLLIKGQRWWWYIIALVLIVLPIFVELELGKSILGPLAWTWPILLWSKMGYRELEHRTRDMVFTSPNILWRQLPVSWLAGFILALVAGLGLATKYLIVGDINGLFTWFIGALFIPSLALALGVWFRTNKAFEIVYLILIYVGVLNGVHAFDFMGVTGEATMGTAFIYLGLSIFLLFVSVIGRREQLQR
ncbi:ABC transporter permease [Bacillus horti]|uniref:MFS family permease n=1 Tax=Caldalkalibacillus horti TaxID=77523 RepID=A0ABT9VYG5_9BACI|nr:ABC transporter permease [Bacillus horti]MDQ0166023.1 MFS family permease [Bacillus horti]